MLYPYKASKYHCFVGNWESYGNIANVRDLISLIYSHKIPKWGKLNEIIYFYNRVLIRLYTAPPFAGKIGNLEPQHGDKMMRFYSLSFNVWPLLVYRAFLCHCCVLCSTQ